MRRGNKIKPESPSLPNTPAKKILPLTHPGKVNWPWTEVGQKISANMSDGSLWPLVSIITPSYNQAEFLEETIRSVLLQGYPNLEYIIIDGVSTDDSVEIIRKYEPWLAFWVSEPDRGQSHAINKGFERSTGEIMAYLNSDDIYFPDVLHFAVTRIMETGCGILLGGMDIMEYHQGETSFIRRVTPNQGPSIHTFPIFANGRVEDFQFMQPSMFWRREIWEKTGQMSEDYTYIMDREWCTRALASGARVKTVDDVLARFTLHAGSKSQEQMPEFLNERAQMYQRLSHQPDFRKLQCLLESFYARLFFWQKNYYLCSDKFKQNGKPLHSYYYLTLARLSKRIKLTIGKLAGR